MGKNARLRYSTIENWSKNMYNLNTKRALVEEGGTIEWVSGSFGSHVSYLYPMSILKGRDSKMEFTGITLPAKARIWIQAPKLFILEKIQVLILILNLFQRMAVSVHSVHPLL